MYRAMINVPGYLPRDDEDHLFDTAGEAWDEDIAGSVHGRTPGNFGDHDLGLAYSVVEVTHSNYPHEPGRLYDCPACEAIMDRDTEIGQDH